MPINRTRHQQAAPLTAQIDPRTFYSLVDVINTFNSRRATFIDELQSNVEKTMFDVDKSHQALWAATKMVNAENEHATRRASPRMGEPEAENGKDLLGIGQGTTFLNLLERTIETIRQTYLDMSDVVRSVKPGRLLMTTKRHAAPATFEELQHMMFEFDLNAPTLQKFVSGVLAIDEMQQRVIDDAELMLHDYQRYHKQLTHRHSIEGLKVHFNPIVTDVAMTVYDNIDSHGEIAEGVNPKEVSTFTLNKARALMNAVEAAGLNSFFREPGRLIKFVKDHLRAQLAAVRVLQDAFDADITDVKSILGLMHSSRRSVDVEAVMVSFDDVNPADVIHREKDVVLSREERFNLKFKNGTVEGVAERLMSATQGEDPEAIVTFILERKAELRKFFLEENSFYVCKIGQGNMFTGEAPGALQVIPGPRPLADFDTIVGQGFDEVKEFFSQVESSAKWHDLFVATSPSKTADKSNVLLIGPQGCGKTEVLRAVGGDRASIGIFAQSSDFLTCWKGEAEKNPKRLFEEGLKLQRESGRHVHFLIDEIDAVLNTDRQFGATNLTLEFQQLMDGVLHYPSLSVWGTTNSPSRIPMPMIRRFSKALIVGELNQDDRVKLLRGFVESFMPSAVAHDAWSAEAKRLEGATGDVIRKVIDHIWRTKMTHFVANNPATATDIISWLNATEKFQVSNFTSAQRAELKGKLGTHFAVTTGDIASSIGMHLGNIAIRSEIETAQRTYAEARAFLSQVKEELPAPETGPVRV